MSLPYQFKEISDISVIVDFLGYGMTELDNLLCIFITRSGFSSNYAYMRYNLPPVTLFHVLKTKENRVHKILDNNIPFVMTKKEHKYMKRYSKKVLIKH